MVGTTCEGSYKQEMTSDLWSMHGHCSKRVGKGATTNNLEIKIVLASNGLFLSMWHEYIQFFRKIEAQSPSYNFIQLQDDRYTLIYVFKSRQ